MSVSPSHVVKQPEIHEQRDPIFPYCSEVSPANGILCTSCKQTHLHVVRLDSVTAFLRSQVQSSDHHVANALSEEKVGVRKPWSRCFSPSCFSANQLLLRNLTNERLKQQMATGLPKHRRSFRGRTTARPRGSETENHSKHLLPGAETNVLDSSAMLIRAALIE